jgi:hypothetical protein
VKFLIIELNDSVRGESFGFETVKVFTIQLKNAVIPAWMLESSHKDVKSCDYNHPVTILGTGFWHPCQNDGFEVINTFTVSFAQDSLVKPH